ncbi:MAG: hypothetical protein OXM02_04100 [Bacteroidota bacterium]|nr:hypothetical protein [Bacteroidota bacterium]MDE2957265.1 hypothetical protein [Bacteroidota bacterium]
MSVHEKIEREEFLADPGKSYADAELRRLFEQQESKRKRDQSARWHLHTISVIGLWAAACVSISLVLMWT